MVNNIVQLGRLWWRVMKGDLAETCSDSLYVARAFVFVFVTTCPPWTVCGSCECWVTLLLQMCSQLSVHPPTAFCKWTLSLAKSLPSHPFFFIPPLSALISKLNTVRGQRGGIIPSRTSVLNSQSRISVDTTSCQCQTLHFISSLSPYRDLKETFR